MDNSTLFSHEKHYLTLNNYLKDIYKKKVFKISLMVILVVLTEMVLLVLKVASFVRKKEAEILRGKEENQSKNNLKTLRK